MTRERANWGSVDGRVNESLVCYANETLILQLSS